VAAATGVSRATARRFLHTLLELGYVGRNGTKFFLRPRVLRLGYAYLSSQSIWEHAQDHIRVLADDGSLLRALTLDPSRDYQPLGTPPGPRPHPKLVNDVLRQVSSMS
jgi:DNA-binding IclR family transcriptional regulator